MDPLFPAERIFKGVSEFNLSDGPVAGAAVVVVEALCTKGALPARMDVVEALDVLANNCPTPDLVDDLRDLQDWLDKGGFFPFVDPATGMAPR